MIIIEILKINYKGCGRMRQIRFADYLKDYLDYNNISNKDFANRIGITPKHLIDILSGERDLSSQLIDSISIVTNIPSDYIYRMELNYKFEKDILEYLQKNNLTINQYLNKFCYQYLIQNKWIIFVDESNKIDIAKDILKFLRVRDPEKVYQIDQEFYFKSKNNRTELLLLWLEKCYRETLNQKVQEYSKNNIDILVKFIREMAMKNEFNEDLLVQTFNKHGIALVIQEDIPGSKIRGAFKVHKNVPSIYITYKHKRIADIYFSLLHELAHCKTDFNKAKASSIISYEDNIESEDNADNQAYEWMVDARYYDSIINSYDYNIEHENKYPKSFIVYRLANDKYIDYSSTIYQKYNFLLDIN